MKHRCIGFISSICFVCALQGCDLSKSQPGDVQKEIKSRPIDTVAVGQEPQTAGGAGTASSAHSKRPSAPVQPPVKRTQKNAQTAAAKNSVPRRKTRAAPRSQVKPTPTRQNVRTQTRTVKAAPHRAPKRFKVRIDTTKGVAFMDVYRDWAPKGADRFYHLVQSGYYRDIAFYRVIDGFIAQFGLHGDPKVSKRWRASFFEDEKTKVSNSKGFVSFAAQGPNSRTTQLFINLKNNRHLDKSDGVPIGRIDKASMKVIAQLYSGYGRNGSPSPKYDRIEKEGNAYLRKAFPKLDYIKSITVVAPEARRTANNAGNNQIKSKPKVASPRLHAQSRAAKTVSIMQGPKAEQLQAPKTFKVLFETTQGSFIITLYRNWAPVGVDRFYNLVKLGFFRDIAFFRVVPNFMAQFGISGDPRIAKAWHKANLKDDKVMKTNARGTVTFATAGPNTRTTQLFINFKDNAFLDQRGFSPIGFIDANGMKVVDRLFSGYGDAPPSGRGPNQARMRSEGHTYLRASFPKLDYIKRAYVLD